MALLNFQNAKSQVEIILIPTVAVHLDLRSFHCCCCSCNSSTVSLGQHHPGACASLWLCSADLEIDWALPSLHSTTPTAFCSSRSRPLAAYFGTLSTAGGFDTVRQVWSDFPRGHGSEITSFKGFCPKSHVAFRGYWCHSVADRPAVGADCCQVTSLLAGSRVDLASIASIPTWLAEMALAWDQTRLYHSCFSMHHSRHRFGWVIGSISVLAV